MVELSVGRAARCGEGTRGARRGDEAVAGAVSRGDGSQDVVPGGPQQPAESPGVTS